MEYRPFKLVKQSELDYINDSVATVIKAWLNIWFIDENVQYHVDVKNIDHCDLITGQESYSWLYGYMENGELLAVNWTRSMADKICRLYIDKTNGEDYQIDIGTELTKAMINQTIISLLELVYSEHGSGSEFIESEVDCISELQNSVSRSGSGYVRITISLADDNLLIIFVNVLDILERKTIVSDHAELSPILGAFGESKLKLEALVGSIELEVKELTSLSSGDVISLDKKLNEKVSLLIDGKELCRGYLGKNGSNISIKVASE